MFALHALRLVSSRLTTLAPSTDHGALRRLRSAWLPAQQSISRQAVHTTAALAAPLLPAKQASVDAAPRCTGLPERLPASQPDLAAIAATVKNSSALAERDLELALAGMLESEVIPLEHSMVSVHDMPCEKRQVGKRMRRQANLQEIVKLVSRVAAEENVCLRAFVEEPQPNPMNGKLSWFGSGYSFGVWRGVLASHGVQIDTVSVLRWKADLALLRQGKEGSRSLALQLYPNATDMLKRKKDHGRAEALLIAAWGLGVRAKRRDPVLADDLAFLAEGEALGPALLASARFTSGQMSSKRFTPLIGLPDPVAVCDEDASWPQSANSSTTFQDELPCCKRAINCCCQKMIYQA
ncbi:hypothetical protein WJX72_012079 [[Myrmecia] bisecta]|uniref:Uncharacterized protein n=1 Tax=[Myrmecia] bisecta TaxID=41462 RepID=A0AAW1Q4Z8_9CHLO